MVLRRLSTTIVENTRLLRRPFFARSRVGRGKIKLSVYVIIVVFVLCRTRGCDCDLRRRRRRRRIRDERARGKVGRAERAGRRRSRRYYYRVRTPATTNRPAVRGER